MCLCAPRYFTLGAYARWEKCQVEPWWNKTYYYWVFPPHSAPNKPGLVPTPSCT